MIGYERYPLAPLRVPRNNQILQSFVNILWSLWTTHSGVACLTQHETQESAIAGTNGYHLLECAPLASMTYSLIHSLASSLHTRLKKTMKNPCSDLENVNFSSFSRPGFQQVIEPPFA